MIGSGGDAFDVEELEELGALLREQRRQEAIDRERELNIFRSGSAPPTVEGSLTAVGGLFGLQVGANVPDLPESKNGDGSLSEEELRSNPAYLSYYYSHVNLNPRLPPPVLSKEDWRSTQRLQVGRSVIEEIGDRRKESRWEEQGHISLFSQQPLFNPQEHAVESRKGDSGCKTPISNHPSRPQSRNAYANGLEALGSSDSQLSLNNDVSALGRQQPGEYVLSVDGLPHSFTSVGSSSHMKSTTPDPQLVARAPSPCLPPFGLNVGTNIQKDKDNLSAIVDSDDLIAAISGFSLSTDGAVAAENTSRTELQSELDDHHKFLFDSLTNQESIRMRAIMKDSDSHSLIIPSLPHSLKASFPDSTAEGQVEVRNLSSRVGDPIEPRKSTISSVKSYVKSPSSPLVANAGGSPGHYQNIESVAAAFAGSSGLSAYSVNPAFPSMLQNHISTGAVPPPFESGAAASAIASLSMDPMVSGGGIFAPSSLAGLTDLQNLGQIGNQSAIAALQTPASDPLYLQYLKAAEYTAQVAASYGDPSMERGYVGNSHAELLGVQNAYIESLLQSQKQYDPSLLGKFGFTNHGYYGSPAFDLGLSYPGSPLAGQIDSQIGPGSALKLGEHYTQFPYGLRNLNGGTTGSWYFDQSHNLDKHFRSSLLEEFKNNKTRCFELAEIAGHVVEFSTDQYGSRFIQQKLETATIEEKNMVFEEIMPRAQSLMTDVFGNYVVQKFFEHGSTAQRRKLSDQLNRHVLALSLQMYGCRVIQKAIEVVDLDQKKKMVLELDGHVMRCVRDQNGKGTMSSRNAIEVVDLDQKKKMVLELDGHVMRCVRDQNGNHVIQKCIECVPQDAIQFIISTFYDQVVTLSTHPYGHCCRVIQRVLEYCDDPNTQQIVMGEILQSVSLLTQDQYGNYVVQHVLEHGKPSERSAIIKKLAGQIVQMSLQKFASNVVEKCLTFGSLEERQILVNEMLGSTEENEPLQAMMKDQFGNYVVQKVLETCDDQQRELILSRIKVHLNALKKYTYGKHIVARVEKLVAAGERRIGFQTQHASSIA
ncbi:hypothetical protein C4D60_Mb11t21540 [Musa balbisiana]|uniref:PUM-HD domain-containing protein n=1 Tax=Musa balbisiana TaxID=52838 RepID=A0A4S8J5U0_MUSBA|nr:hypothetical protein C4D60_Mb11t21540 [Musa balbisiana]